MWLEKGISQGQKISKDLVSKKQICVHYTNSHKGYYNNTCVCKQRTCTWWSFSKTISYVLIFTDGNNSKWFECHYSFDSSKKWRGILKSTLNWKNATFMAWEKCGIPRQISHKRAVQFEEEKEWILWKEFSLSWVLTLQQFI